MTETESRPHNRALVASFLFTDLVGYSKGTAAEQYAAKAALSAILTDNLKALRKEDYLIKDTGDGALIIFLSNPEHALYAALAMVQGFARAAANGGFPSNRLRTGLHMGAVKEAIDLEDRPNFVGDGINAAKRIMDFAAPGQITASRSYFEAVSWLDSAYASLFQHLGASDDKHGRAHELYAIVPSDVVLAKLRSEFAPARETKAPQAARASPSATQGAGRPPEISTNVHAPASRAPVPKSLLAVGALIVVAAAVSITIATRPPTAPTAVQSNPMATDPSSGSRDRTPAASAIETTPAPRAASAPAGAAAPMRATPAATPGNDASASVVSSPPGAAAEPADAKSGRSVHNPERTAPPPASRSVTLAPSIPSSGTDVKRKSAETQGAAATADGTAGRGSVRCRIILEKAAVGEPLSPDEKRELASCR